MAVSIFKKAKVSALGLINDMVDKKYNTPSAYRQNIRDLEKAMAELSAAKDETVAIITGYDRQLSKLENDISAKNAMIILFLTDDDESNDHHAETLQTQINEFEDDKSQLEQAKAETQLTIDEYIKAIQKGYGIRDRMVKELRQLELKADSASAKKAAASAIEDALDAFGATGSIDNIARKINADADAADAKFNRVVGELNTPESPEEAAKKARAAAQIAELKKKLSESDK